MRPSPHLCQLAAGCAGIYWEQDEIGLGNSACDCSWLCCLAQALYTRHWPHVCSHTRHCTLFLHERLHPLLQCDLWAVGGLHLAGRLCTEPSHTHALHMLASWSSPFTTRPCIPILTYEAKMSSPKMTKCEVGSVVSSQWLVKVVLCMSNQPSGASYLPQLPAHSHGNGCLMLEMLEKYLPWRHYQSLQRVQA